MKVTVSSKGADEIINKIKALQQKANVNSFDSILEKIANRVRSYIIDDYKLNGSIWREVNGNLETVDGDDVIVEKKGSTYIIAIGRNTEPFDMPNRQNSSNPNYAGLPKTVNPYFFIEFGFGIIGQNNPIKNAPNFGWRYNLRPYSHGWHFRGLDGTRTYSRGTKGIGTISTLINGQFERIVNEVMAEERANGSTAR